MSAHIIKSTHAHASAYAYESACERSLAHTHTPTQHVVLASKTSHVAVDFKSYVHTFTRARCKCEGADAPPARRTAKWFTDFPAEVLEEGADAGLSGRLATARSCGMEMRKL